MYLTFISQSLSRYPSISFSGEWKILSQKCHMIGQVFVLICPEKAVFFIPVLHIFNVMTNVDLSTAIFFKFQAFYPHLISTKNIFLQKYNKFDLRDFYDS
jgi:hypothetical protein